MDKWVYSTDEERFDSERFKTKELAVDEALKNLNKSCPVVAVGRTVPIMPTIDADIAIENISEQLYSELGEIADGYLEDVTKEEYEDLQSELNKVFNAWMDKHNRRPNFYRVVDVEEFRLEDEQS